MVREKSDADTLYNPLETGVYIPLPALASCTSNAASVCKRVKTVFMPSGHHLCEPNGNKKWKAIMIPLLASRSHFPPSLPSSRFFLRHHAGGTAAVLTNHHPGKWFVHCVCSTCAFNGSFDSSKNSMIVCMYAIFTTLISSTVLTQFLQKIRSFVLFPGSSQKKTLMQTALILPPSPPSYSFLLPPSPPSHSIRSTFTSRPPRPPTPDEARNRQTDSHTPNPRHLYRTPEH
jgi:hypothetical protein